MQGLDEADGPAEQIEDDQVGQGQVDAPASEASGQPTGQSSSEWVRPEQSAEDPPPLAGGPISTNQEVPPSSEEPLRETAPDVEWAE